MKSYKDITEKEGYIILVGMMDYIIVKDNMEENWNIISKNFEKTTIIKDIEKMLSIN
jgi:hypothetical protein